MSTPASTVDYVERILGKLPTEKAKADVLAAQSRHGIDRDHPVLGVICEMILYREQMDGLLKRAEGAAQRCELASQATSTAAATLAAEGKAIAERVATAEKAARQRLEEPVRSLEAELKARRAKLDQDAEHELRERRTELLRREHALSERARSVAWSEAMSFRKGLLLMLAGLGIAFGGGVWVAFQWGHVPGSILSCTVAQDFVDPNTGLRWLRCQ